MSAKPHLNSGLSVVELYKCMGRACSLYNRWYVTGSFRLRIKGAHSVRVALYRVMHLLSFDTKIYRGFYRLKVCKSADNVSAPNQQVSDHIKGGIIRLYSL